MKKIGSQTFKLDNPVTILETASIVGKKEADGPMAKYFDVCLEDEFYGEKTWEKAESKMIKTAIETVIRKSDLSVSSIDYLFAGDLLNQCISSSFGIAMVRSCMIMDDVMYGVMFNAKMDIFSKDPPVNAEKKLNAPLDCWLANQLLKYSLLTPGTGS